MPEDAYPLGNGADGMDAIVTTRVDSTEQRPAAVAVYGHLHIPRLVLAGAPT